MGEVIILSEWKREKELEALSILEKDLDAYMQYLDVQREFYMFDDNGNAVLIHREGVCK